MENKQTKKRVVLNLSLDQARQLNSYFLTNGGNIAMLKLQQRIERTITKHDSEVQQ